MELILNNKNTVLIRTYQENDFNEIQQLNRIERWNNLVEKNEETKEAWRNSNIAFIVESDDRVIGYVRGLTDTMTSLYICEVLIDQEYRGLGVAKSLLRYVHGIYPKTRLDLLASSTSHTFYEAQGYRAFYGFRKTFAEY
jgi:ribosomal protein S18 acetylase RimI-like enzyme